MTDKDEARHLAKRTKHGVAWSAMGQFIAQGLRYGSMIFLARLLSPADFGLMAAAMLTINVLLLIKDFGLAGALVQRQGASEEGASTIFIIVMASGICLTAIAYFAAPAAAVFFENAQVTAIIQSLALTLILRSVGVVPAALLDKRMHFEKKFVGEVSSGIFEFSVPLAFGLMGYGVWSLVYGQFAAAVVGSAVLWWMSGWMPRLHFDRQVAVESIRFGKYMVSEGLVRFCSANVDNIIVGKVLGLTMLGYYTMAYRLVTLPTLLFSYNVTRVAFPAFARIQTDKEQLARLYLSILRYVWLLILPIYIGIFALAPILVPAVFGDQWDQAIVPIQTLVLFGVLSALVGNTKELYMAVGQPKLAFTMESVRLVLLVPFLLQGAASFGLAGVGLAQSLVMCLVAPFHMFYAFRIIGQGWRAFSGAVGKTTLSAAVLLVALLASKTAFGLADWPVRSLSGLISLSLLGFATYGTMTLIMDRSTVSELFRRWRD